MSKYNNEKEILKDFDNGKINKWEKNVQLGRLGKNAEYFTDDELMCMYCDELYLCDNNWTDSGKLQFEECKKKRLQ